MYAEELYYDSVYYLYFPKKEPRRKNLLGGTNKTNSIFFPFVTFYHFLFNVPIQKCILLSFLFTVFSKKILNWRDHHHHDRASFFGPRALYFLNKKISVTFLHHAT